MVLPVKNGGSSHLRQGLSQESGYRTIGECWLIMFGSGSMAVKQWLADG